MIGFKGSLGSVGLAWQCVSLVLFASALHAVGGIIMEDMVLPPASAPVWAVASAGRERYAGGWLPLDRPVFVRVHAEPLRFLRVDTARLGPLALTGPIWDEILVGEISAVDRLLLGWALSVPEYPRGPIALALNERMLFLPWQLRIDMEPLRLDEGE